MQKKLASGAGALVATTGMMVAMAAPASAADTTVTFTLAGGSLSLAAAAGATLTDGNSGSTSVSGPLGNVTVTDNRGGIQGWSAKAATSAFGNGTTTATGVSYNSGVVTPGGVVTSIGSGATALSSTPAQVVAATVVVGNNTATWNPTLTVTLPASSTAGSYTGTITTSVS